MSDEEHGIVVEPHEGSKVLEVGNAASREASPSGQGDVAAGSGPSKEHTTESSRLENQDASSRSESIIPTILRMIQKKLGKRLLPLAPNSAVFRKPLLRMILFPHPSSNCPVPPDRMVRYKIRIIDGLNHLTCAVWTFDSPSAHGVLPQRHQLATSGLL
ncbi:hypothetical protein MTO96_011452 [Rhipicephalus appendiculatus]